MSELTDLNATSNGLSAVSGGLQGLLEAYKMKMAQSVEQAKITQSGLDAGANARAMGAYRDATLAEKAREFNVGGGAATSAPIVSPDGKFIQEKGKWVPIPQGAGVKEAEKKATALEMLDSLSTKWDSLATGSGTGSATMNGALLKMKSMAPSTDAGQYDAAAQAFAGKLDHDLLGRVNDLTISNAKKAIPGFYDTPESKKNKMDYIRGIYAKAPEPSLTSSPTPAPQPTPGPMSTLRAALPSSGVAPAPAVPDGSLPSASVPSPVEVELRRRGVLGNGS